MRFLTFVHLARAKLHSKCVFQFRGKYSLLFQFFRVTCCSGVSSVLSRVTICDEAWDIYYHANCKIYSTWRWNVNWREKTLRLELFHLVNLSPIWEKMLSTRKIFISAEVWYFHKHPTFVFTSIAGFIELGDETLIGTGKKTFQL